ncbi:non-ribosomal peptide synthetase [Aspergillus mulundensis]|uniref:NRPS-like enzyme, putative (JCVI) n=1 Tax=Aspergillus mulundensis TaxID=1810919 RepID=A0A3D8T325_9EURO|nr:NRPS-like enzyme, putative (JCVI) [Aspergillus mulundensis]RDW92953.1 NRPS-like enzyme, putative (JCVI) [Aspergillus mulundensis]
MGSNSQFSTDVGLARLLEQKLGQFSEQVAVEQGTQRMTFRDLHVQALALAHEIRVRTNSQPIPIPIVASRGIEHIVCQAAVVLAGAICVPLDVELPDDRLGELISYLEGACLLLTDPKNQERCLPTNIPHVVVDSRIPQSQQVGNGACNKHEQLDQQNGHAHDEVATNGHDCNSVSHIFFTSGSTGKPKAVQVRASGLLNLIFNDFAPLGQGQRLGHVCNTGFDVSMWEIWSGLLHGATIVVFERGEILDAHIMEQKLREARIDVIWQTTSLLGIIAHVCPAAYATVDTLLTGGEAINMQTIRRIFDHGPPRRLYNAYGPTELSVLATYHLVSEADLDRDLIPIGRPLSGYDAFVVGEDMREVCDGEVGELVVGGMGVAAGYLGNPEKTSKVFVHAPHLVDVGGIVYRTGDLVRKNGSGQLEYLGRRDNEVKIGGQRVELEAVERCLLDTGLVSLAVALRVSERWAGEGSCSSLLAAYVVPMSDDIDDRSILLAYQERSRHMMVPRLRVVSRIPLTGSGKMNRKALAREFETEMEGIKGGPVQQQLVDAGDELNQIWARVLGRSLSSLSAEDDFFALGGTSLHAVRLVHDINRSMGISLEVAMLFENPTLERMSEAVRKLRSHTNGKTADGRVKKPQWVEDMDLGQDLQVTGAPVDWQKESEGRAFLTGATGFVGAMLLAQLLAHPKVTAVACLVRAKDNHHARARLREALSKYNQALTSSEAAKIVPVAGDLAQDDLGLGAENYRQYANWSSVVFHLAAHVNYIEPYSTHRPANVLGTLNVIRFSQASRSKSLHYTSSVSAYGPTGLISGTKYLAEDERPREHMQSLEYDTGYAQSKFTAETIVWNAIDAGMPITIYRLGSALPPHGNSKALKASDDFFTRLLRTCIQLGVYPSIPGHREDLISIDWVTSSILHISSKSASARQAYNIVHPHQQVPDLPTIFQSVNGYLGRRPLRELPYREWLDTISQPPDNPLTSLVPMLEEPVRDGLSRWQMQQAVPKFLTDNLRRVLVDAPELLDCLPPAELIEMYIPHWVREASASQDATATLLAPTN